jgi:hypothetical protein
MANVLGGHAHEAMLGDPASDVERFGHADWDPLTQKLLAGQARHWPPM